MKHSWIIIALFLFTNCSNDNSTTKATDNGVQKNETIKIDDGEEVFTIVDEMPRLTGCGDDIDKKKCSEKKLLQYLYANVEYDAAALENQDLEYRIVFSFVVEKDGTVSNFEFVKGTESKWNVRSVVESMPLWIPGKLNGKAKRVKMHIPMNLIFDVE